MQTKPAVDTETEVQLTYEQSAKLAEALEEPAVPSGEPYVEWMRGEAERSRTKHSSDPQ